MVGQLLAVKGERKPQAAVLPRQHRKVRRDPPADRLGGGVQAALRQPQIFTRCNAQKILRQLPAPWLAAALQKLPGLQKQRLAVFCGHNADPQRLVRQTGVGLGKQVTRPGLAQQRLASPDVQVLHVHPPSQHHAQRRGSLPGLQQNLPLGKCPAAHPQRGYGCLGLGGGQSAEQWYIRQFHNYAPHMLLLQQNSCCHCSKMTAQSQGG